MSVMVVASRPCPKLAPYIRSLRLDESRSNAESNSGAYRFFNHPSASDNPLEQPVKLIPTRNSQKNRGRRRQPRRAGSQRSTTPTVLHVATGALDPT